MAQSSPYFLWDNPAGGFFIVTMLEVGKNDVGHYWCGTSNGTSVAVIKNISLMTYSDTAPLPGQNLGTSGTSTTAGPKHLHSPAERTVSVLHSKKLSAPRIQTLLLLFFLPLSLLPGADSWLNKELHQRMDEV
ncbi:hypothetical protein J0S82_011231 [Galemys pyrenaicus]|uniref:Immunoglobulin V-set domain-containing protein n=1 Tax=Galemys pyrenaicus TaxID=202257 RepID=A0A8J6A3P4_GALPY|nr:hypothetical protein J0S82_011231 [Galemys pyrenaicus]